MQALGGRTLAVLGGSFGAKESGYLHAKSTQESTTMLQVSHPEKAHGDEWSTLQRPMLLRRGLVGGSGLGR